MNATTKQSEDLAHARKILAALDKAIAEGPWDKTVFLSAMGKKLLELRTRFKQELDLAEQSALKEAKKSVVGLFNNTHPELKEVFISLYNVDGNNIRKWEKIIEALEHHPVTRSVYGSEDEIKALFRTKTNLINEGYVAVYIPQSSIIHTTADKTPHDRLGYELLLLKDKAVKLDNIHYFKHISGRYNYKENKLTRQIEQ